MPNIELLDQQTIDQIAAGEVIERPASVVKELVENAIDAHASAITVEIKDGGTSFIRVTDNGCGIEEGQVPIAFLRHSTSKIHSVEDLLTVSSLGFRGEALSSIAAVSQVELITKTSLALSGTHYCISGGQEESMEEIGAPEGTTFLVRNLFYNTPARRKFLKTPQTEAGYVGSLLERMALSHPEISFKLIANHQVKLDTSGNSNLREVIYHIYGRDIASGLLPLQGDYEGFSVDGYIGKPLISRGNRNFENYFVNGRCVKSNFLAKCIEDGYQSFTMQHKYPFTALNLSIPGELLDVNVHPSKMELRFRNQEQLYEQLSKCIRDAINQSELVYRLERDGQEGRGTSNGESGPGGRGTGNGRVKPPEPFEKNRMAMAREAIQRDSPYEPKYEGREEASRQQSQLGLEEASRQQSQLGLEGASRQQSRDEDQIRENPTPFAPSDSDAHRAADDALFTQEGASGQLRFLEPESRKYHKVIGQVFDTYWLVEMEDTLYVIDQHAAHEKVLYERAMASLANKEHASQALFPPMLLTLSLQETELLKKYEPYFSQLGYEIEHFGGREYAVNAVPANMFGINERALLIELIDSLSEMKGNETPQVILEKIASMSCKAAVKGNQRLSRQEMEALIDELLGLENPYHCPHGRPTIFALTRRELEKKFRRVQ